MGTNQKTIKKFWTMMTVDIWEFPAHCTDIIKWH